MSDIPKARDLLDQAIKHIENGDSASACSCIGEARLLMKRERYRPTVAPHRWRRVNNALKIEIGKYALNNPKIGYSEISEQFGINIGRVSDYVKEYVNEY